MHWEIVLSKKYTKNDVGFRRVKLCEIHLKKAYVQPQKYVLPDLPRILYQYLKIHVYAKSIESKTHANIHKKYKKFIPSEISSHRRQHFHLDACRSNFERLIILLLKISRRYFGKLGFQVNVYRKIIQSRKFSRNSFVNLNVVPLQDAIDSIALDEMKVKCAHWILFAFVFARATIESAIVGDDKPAKRGCWE